MRPLIRSLVVSILALLLFLVLAAPVSKNKKLPPVTFDLELEPAYVAKEGEHIREGFASSDGSKFLLTIGTKNKTIVIDQDGLVRKWDATMMAIADKYMNKLAYVGIKDREMYAVIDTLVMGPYDYIPNLGQIFSGIIFSDDGAHWMFRARHDEEAAVILGGMEVAHGSDFGTFPPYLCRDGRHWAVDIRLGDKSAYVVNGVLGRPYKIVLPVGALSDSCQFAYVGVEADSLRWVIHGADFWGPFAEISQIGIAPRTNDVVFLAKLTKSAPSRVYKNGALLFDLPEVVSASYSSSGVLGIMYRNDSGMIQGMLDTLIIPPADSLRGFWFDSTAHNYGYVRYSLTKKGKRPRQYDVQLMVNGLPYGGKYSDIGEVWISQEGSHVAFNAYDKSGRQFLVVDSSTFGPIDDVTGFYYSRDDQQYAAFIADGDGKHIVHQGWLSPGFNEIYPFPLFDTLRDVSVYFALKDRAWNLMTGDSTLLSFSRMFWFPPAFDSLGVLRGYGCRADTVYRFTLRPPTDSLSTDSL